MKGSAQNFKPQAQKFWLPNLYPALWAYQTRNEHEKPDYFASGVNPYLHGIRGRGAPIASGLQILTAQAC